MKARSPVTLEAFATHEVFNQTPAFVDVDLASLDKPMLGALAAFGEESDAKKIVARGPILGSAENLELARLANENPPKLKLFDARGERQDFVEFHPAYHALMRASIAAGLASSTFEAHAPKLASPPGKLHGKGNVARSALHYLTSGVEAGHLCPVTMTHAGIAVLAAAPDQLEKLMPLIFSRVYDASFRPFWEKQGVTLGMGMTEKQGGSDVRANTTRAERIAKDEYEITGHKWFFSAPMCDAFLVLAQAAGGLTCFLMPRFRPDGALNGLRLQRLKDKLGNRSNASSEVEFVKAFAWRVGEEGRGVATIIEMVQLTRLDCISASAGLMRMGLALAMHHARHRIVFQRKLVDQPAMRSTLADLALTVEGAAALVLRLARAFDRASEDASEAQYARLMTPAAKFVVCKAAPAFLYEAMECLGGNGYVEETPLPRLYREAPVNAIWEGCGNIMALDVLRAASRDRDAAHGVLTDLVRDTQGLPGVRATKQRIEVGLARSDAEASARAVTQDFATLATVEALARCAPPAIVEAFARTRLSRSSLVVGAAELSSECGELLARALPTG
ncbi:MAG: acyl-CoA dehydrogenase family protein [Hyphomicrobiales bacterium]|nr:acyl-CoA dehydrogenase family protein [Hyphomicrobiales bacterium]